MCPETSMPGGSLPKRVSLNITFIDPKCPTPYDSEVMATRALGGTESTVVRVARGLSRRHHVTVVQHNRTITRHEGRTLAFLPPTYLQHSVGNANHVVFIQKAQQIRQVAAASNARLWIWLHNYLSDDVRLFWHDHLRYRLGIICVSKTHRAHTQRYLRKLPAYWATLGLLQRGGLLYHYNPIDESLAPSSDSPPDRHKLVFFSAPTRGLDQVLTVFSRAHAIDPLLRLYVADPGYVKNFDTRLLEQPGVIRLGPLPQRDVLRHVREALCVFSPQRRAPETFGLVYAEANACGTPVIAHRFGAAAEVLCPENPPLNANDEQAVIDTLFRWISNGRPLVSANPRFSLSNVIQGWEDFLAAPDWFVRKQQLTLAAREPALPEHD